MSEDEKQEWHRGAGEEGAKEEEEVICPSHNECNFPEPCYHISPHPRNPGCHHNYGGICLPCIPTTPMRETLDKRFRMR